MQCDFTLTTLDPFSPSPATTRMPDPYLHTTLTPTLGVNTTPGGVIPTPTYTVPTIAPERSEFLLSVYFFYFYSTYPQQCEL
jgi:hypothetical protein